MAGVLAALAAGNALAQADVQPAARIEPFATVTETLTDSYNAGATSKSADSVTQLTGGLAVRGRSAHVRGFLDYALTQVIYLRHGSENKLQHALNANGQADLLDGRLLLDAGANISRQAVSAFGSGATESDRVNGNTVETRTLRLAPTLRGQFNGVLNYRTQFGWVDTRASGGGIGSNTGTSASLNVSPVQRSQLNWAGDLFHATNDYDGARSITSDRAYGTAIMDIESLDLQLRGSGGVESSNYASASREKHTTWGAGLVWEPSPRTRVDAMLERRAYGNSHQLSAQYRTPRTAWSLTSSRSLDQSNGAQTGSLGTAYNLFAAQLSSAYPDPAQRDAAVVALLQRFGIPANAAVNIGYLTAATTVTDRLEFSAVWQAARDAATFTLARIDSRRVDTLSSVIDDLSRSAAVHTRQASLTLSHQLYPGSLLSVTGALSNASGDGAGQRNNSRQVNATWTHPLGRYVSGLLTLRRSVKKRTTFSLTPQP